MPELGDVGKEDGALATLISCSPQGRVIRDEPPSTRSLFNRVRVCLNFGVGFPSAS